MQWKHREMRGLTSAGRKYRGLRGKVRFETLYTSLSKHTFHTFWSFSANPQTSFSIFRATTTTRPAPQSAAPGSATSRFPSSATVKCCLPTCLVLAGEQRGCDSCHFNAFLEFASPLSNFPNLSWRCADSTAKSLLS